MIILHEERSNNVNLTDGKPMFELSEIQRRFEIVSEKKQWEKLKSLLLSEKEESIKQGISLLESLDEQFYYDGICSFFVLLRSRVVL